MAKYDQLCAQARNRRFYFHNDNGLIRVDTGYGIYVFVRGKWREEYRPTRAVVEYKDVSIAIQQVIHEEAFRKDVAKKALELDLAKQAAAAPAPAQQATPAEAAPSTASGLNISFTTTTA